jgi:SAM-dependent methyltransferase
MNDKTRKAVIKEYDRHYRVNPKKWGGQARDDFAVAALREWDIKTILDVGCGNGHTLAKLKEAFPLAYLWGLDPSPVACDLAHKNSGAQTVTGFLEEYNPGMKFDLVINLGTLEHLENPLVGLIKMRELTGTVCYLEIPHNLLYSPGEHGYRRLTTRSRQIEWHLERGEWEVLIQQAGFTIEKSLTGLNEAWEFCWMLK